MFRIKQHLPLLSLLGMALLCSCGGFEPIEPVTETIEFVLPEGVTLPTETTTMETTTTTTTTNVYTPPNDTTLTELLSQMTLREKAAQMMLVGCVDAGTAEAVCQEGAGGLCLFAAPFSGKSAEQVREMTARFQNAANVPVLVSVDEEGGGVCRVSLNPQLRPNIFFSPHYLFGLGGWDLIESDTAEKADFLLDLGINSNLAPVCDVPLHDYDYIAGRCLGTNAEDTAHYIDMVVSIMKEKHIGSTLKHFPGYGGSGDTHKNMAYDQRTLEEFESRDLLPFVAGIAAGADSVMVTHNIVECMDKDYPASLSPEVHRYLREELGFRGVIITDDLGMNAIIQFTNGQSPAVAAVKAGNDLLCYADFQGSVNAIVEAVEQGEVDEETIDASVLRILYWKQSIGLL